MENKISLKPPYPSTGQADAILDLFRRISPKKIDSKFIVENKIATPPNASTVVNFVKWFGIIDEDNSVREEVASKLRLMGEERDKFLVELIKSSYKEVFEVVNLQTARREDLVNFFINHYGYGIAPAKNASILLLHLCEKYGLPISEDLKKKSYTPDNGKPRERKPIVKKDRLSSGKSDSNISINKLEGIIINIPNSGLAKEYNITSEEEFRTVFETELKKIAKILEITFDWESKS